MGADLTLMATCSFNNDCCPRSSFSARTAAAAFVTNIHLPRGLSWSKWSKQPCNRWRATLWTIAITSCRWRWTTISPIPNDWRGKLTTKSARWSMRPKSISTGIPYQCSHSFSVSPNNYPLAVRWLHLTAEGGILNGWKCFVRTTKSFTVRWKLSTKRRNVDNDPIL